MFAVASCSRERRAQEPPLPIESAAPIATTPGDFIDAPQASLPLSWIQDMPWLEGFLPPDPRVLLLHEDWSVDAEQRRFSIFVELRVPRFGEADLERFTGHAGELGWTRPAGAEAELAFEGLPRWATEKVEPGLGSSTVVAGTAYGPSARPRVRAAAARVPGFEAALGLMDSLGGAIDALSYERSDRGSVAVLKLVLDAQRADAVRAWLRERGFLHEATEVELRDGDTRLSAHLGPWDRPDVPAATRARKVTLELRWRRSG